VGPALQRAGAGDQAERQVVAEADGAGGDGDGLGLSQALPIFAEIRETLGLPVVTDVHEAGHCAEAAQA
jgi:3-deoxy-D-manno-octulosonic acid (KDO) 8-phosphate synthase